MSHADIIGLKELRDKAEDVIEHVEKGQSYIVVRRSKPVFRIVPIDDPEEVWEEVIDFTKLQKGGIQIADLLSRL